MNFRRSRGARLYVTDPLTESLPLPQRLALSYAPRASRAAILGLLVLDQRLAGVVAMGGEAMIAQIKLAWWRDRLTEPREAWPAGEPLLDHFRALAMDPAHLVPLVDGFEALLAEDFGEAELESYLRGKSLGWAGVTNAGGHGGDLSPIEQAARELALFDLDGRLTADCETALVADATAKEPWMPARLPKALRPLAVLHALAKRARHRGQAELLEGPAAMAFTMRVGLFGR